MRHRACVAATLLLLGPCSTQPAFAASVRALAPINVPAIARPAGEAAAWWFRAGATAAANSCAGRQPARKIILFVGDGMSLPIVVTADHLHTMTFMGDGPRGNPILGKVDGASRDDRGRALAKDELGLPCTALGYASGPGYVGASKAQPRPRPQRPKHFPHVTADAQPASGRPDRNGVHTEVTDYPHEATLPLSSETHGSDDVGVLASGPGAPAVHG